MEKKKPSPLNGFVIFFIVVFAIEGIFFLWLKIPEWLLPARLERALPDSLEQIGLENVEVDVKPMNSDRACIVDIYCSNWSDYSYREMFSMQKKIDTAVYETKKEISDIYCAVIPWNIYCNGNRYVVYSYTNGISINGETVYSDYDRSDAHKDYLEDHPEEAENERIRKAGLPYVGMSERLINSTSLGSHNGNIRHNIEIKNGQRYTANIYDFSGPDGVIYTARCVDGAVTEVWDHRDSPRKYSPTISNNSGSSVDPYDAKSYRNAEDFYEYYYDDFADFYDAENYYRDHT